DVAGTHRVYTGTLRALLAHQGPLTPVAALGEPPAVATITAWFLERWGSSAPATFNRNLDALRSAIGYWQAQDWLASDRTRQLRRRRPPHDRTRAVSRAAIEQLLGRDDIPLR